MADEHMEAVARFFRIVGWDPNASATTVQRGRESSIQSNPFFPGTETPTVLFLSDGDVLGYVTSIPILIWEDGNERRAEWIKGVMVHPEHRNGPIGFLLIKELMKRLNSPLSLVVGKPARRLFAALGMTEIGTIPNYIRLLNPGTVCKKLDLQAVGVSLPSWLGSGVRFAQRTGLATVVGALAGHALAFKTLVRSSGNWALRAESPDGLPEESELDEVWRLTRSELKLAPVRNGRYLRWRYGDGAAYKAITVREDGALIGFGVVRRARPDGDPRLRGVRTASLSDMLFPPCRPDVAAALLRTADIVARSLEADVLLCSASHEAVQAALSRRGYLRAPANLHLLSRTRADEGVAPTLPQWWVMRGDSNADEVF